MNVFEFGRILLWSTKSLFLLYDVISSDTIGGSQRYLKKLDLGEVHLKSG